MKLAGAALFFTLIAQVIAVVTPQGRDQAIASASTNAEVQPLETSSLAEAIILAQAKRAAEEAAAKSERIPISTKAVVVKGKMYPYKLVIPAIKVNVGVLGMGIADDGRMAVPNNYTEVGWYNLGSRPGEVGSTVMGAHVDNGGSINGVFKNLKKLKTGDVIYVTDGDGDQYTYKVTAKKIYNYKTQVTDEVFGQDDKGRLNLITCYGTWLPQENTYNKRLVVFAELQKTILTQR